MNAAALLRLLGDDARLRMLRVLQAERLNVTRAHRHPRHRPVGVSRHLGLLKEAGLAVEERDGGFTYFPAAPGPRPERRGLALDRFLHDHFEAFGRTAAGRADDRGWRKCGGCGRRTSTRTPGRTPRSVSSFPAGAGRPGPGRWATCCPRCASPISVAARAI